MFFKCSQVIEWFHRVFFSSKIPIFFSGLIIIHGLVEYSMLAILVTYLTDYVALRKAAQLVNIHEGLSSLLVIVGAQLSDTCFGHLPLIIFTHTAFILGLGMLWYESHRLSIKVLFGALALLTLGKAGRDVTLQAFFSDQLWRSNEDSNLEEDREFVENSNLEEDRELVENSNLEEDRELVETRPTLIWGVNWIFGIIAATVWSSSNENLKWETLAKTCTIAMVAGFSVFLLGITFYKRKAPYPSPILFVFNVVRAAILKRRLDYPVSPSQLFKNDSTSDREILPHIAFLRWLDKAAILEPSPPCPVSAEQAETAGRLFEVAKVRDVKRLISMFPLWSSFYVLSIVEATAGTFFYVHADYMDDHLGKISHVPIVIFVIIKASTSSITSIICELIKRKGSAQRRPPLYRIVLGMLCSFLCCLTAWRVEVYRRSELVVWVDENNEEQKDNEISVFWLTPQFFLVGLMDGLASSGLQDFFETQVCESMKGYGPEFSEFATGIGKIFSVICILIFSSWFKGNVNKSRLDKYYAMLMVPTFLNFWFCWFVSDWYANQQTHDMDIAQELEDGIQEILTNENSAATQSTN